MLNKRTLMSVVVLLLAAAALGEVKVLKLKDGRSFTGEITKTKDGYRIRTKLAVLTFPADQVAGIEEAASPTTEYDRRLKKIDKTKPEDHFRLGSWAFKAGLLKVARKHLRIAVKLKPDYERAKLLLQLVAARIEQTAKPPKNDGGKVVQTGDFPLLEKEDIYRIRIEELRPGERVRVNFRNDVVRRFIASMKGHDRFNEPGFRRKFLAYRRHRKLHYMLRQRPDDLSMKKDILIESDPKFMQGFRQFWPIVKSSCAASNCHGGARPKGGFTLYVTGAGDERADYTNFVILDGVTSGGRRLIDRDYPTESMLLHFLLPAKQARYRHPEKIAPAFRDRKAAAYKRILRWIEDLKGPPHPDYHLKYRPPFGMKLYARPVLDLPSPTTQPDAEPGREDDFFR